MCYINPISPEVVEKIIKEQNIKYISTLEDRHVKLYFYVKKIIFDKYAEVLGTTIDNITQSEDRNYLKKKLNQLP